MEEGNYTVISTDPDREGGNNLLKLSAECEVWVRVPLKLTTKDVEIHPITLMEVIKGSSSNRFDNPLDPPLNRIEDALKEDLCQSVQKRRIGEHIDYERLEKLTEEGSYFDDYVYGTPKITNLTLEIID